MKLIGYLSNGLFVCCDCLLNPDRLEPPPILVHEENVGGSSVACTACNEVVVRGSDDFMFGQKPRYHFGAREAQAAQATIMKAGGVKDWESVKSSQTAFYEDVLRAIVHDQLADKDEVFKIVQLIFEVRTAW